MLILYLKRQCRGSATAHCDQNHQSIYVEKVYNIHILSAASRGFATAQVGVVGLVRFTVGVLVSARSVTKRMSEQCLCKEEGKLERQNIPAKMLAGFSICANGLRNQRKIESETAIDR